MASACAVLSIRRAEWWGKAKLVGGVPVDLAKGRWDGAVLLSFRIAHK